MYCVLETNDEWYMSIDPLSDLVSVLLHFTFMVHRLLFTLKYLFISFLVIYHQPAKPVS